MFLIVNVPTICGVDTEEMGACVAPDVLYPQTSGASLANPRRLDRHRDVVGVDLARHQHILSQQVIQRLQQFTHCAGPTSERGPTELHALSAVDFRLTVVQRVLGELRRDDACQQARPRIAALDGF